MAQKFQRTEKESMKTNEPGRSSGSGNEEPNTLNPKRVIHEEEDDPKEKKRRIVETSAEDELLLEQLSLVENSKTGEDLMNVFDLYRGKWEPNFYVYDPYVWEVSMFEDMCSPEKVWRFEL